MMALARSRIPRVDPEIEPTKVAPVVWLTTGDCAKRLGVTSRLIARWIDTGRLLGFTLPATNARRVHPQVLADFEASEGFARAKGKYDDRK
jgi:hypothetical protein